MSYETMLGDAGLLLKFTFVKMRGPNKSLSKKIKNKDTLWWVATYIKVIIN